jgi:DNA-binding winged helix-turn-helix (wHTH) protein/pimeloyl-ACP methyl ester carboxylesterase
VDARLHVFPINGSRGKPRPLAQLTFFCYFSDSVNSDLANNVYEFGPFRLELTEHRLMSEGRPIPLTGKAFDTLRVLLERHGKLVPKQELMNAVWPESTVEENNLDRNISALRKILGEHASGILFIETVPRIGYRFVAPVTRIPQQAMTRRAGDREPDLPSRQEIRFCVTPDNVRLAYATVGSGYPLVKAADCFNHLDFEWESPIWRHWVRDLARDRSILRYDLRGSGLSQWDVEDLSFESWVQDLETVVDAAGLERFALMGHSQGGAVAITYAARHPERVSHLILFGGYSRGADYRGNPEAAEARRALETLVELNWGKVNPSFFQLVTDLYIPERATPEEHCWFKDLQLISCSTANLVKVMRTCDQINVRHLLPSVSAPTIVFHTDGDRIAPPEEGRIIAAEIPGARFVPLSSANHTLLADEPAWKMFCDELAAFLRSESRASQKPFPAEFHTAVPAFVESTNVGK